MGAAPLGHDESSNVGCVQSAATASVDQWYDHVASSATRSVESSGVRAEPSEATE